MFVYHVYSIMFPTMLLLVIHKRPNDLNIRVVVLQNINHLYKERSHIDGQIDSNWQMNTSSILEHLDSITM